MIGKMSRMLRLDNVLVQQATQGNGFCFAFRGKRWSLYTSGIAVVLFIGTSMVKSMSDVHFKEFLVLGGYIFTCLFIWSAIYSYFTSKILDIDGAEKMVRYRISNFFGTRAWAKDFSDFAEVRIWRPGRDSFLVVVLRMKDGQEIPLGTNEAGTLRLEKAREIAESIAAIMNVPVKEESTV